jgi:hypothetical protein
MTPDEFRSFDGMFGRGERKGFGRRGDIEGVEKVGQKGSGGNVIKGGGGVGKKGRGRKGVEGRGRKDRR